MFAFKPKAEPILTQIAKSGLFQFMMVIALGVGVTWFVIRTDRPQQWIQKINRFASVAPNPQAQTEAGIAEDQADIEAPPPPQGTWAMRSVSSTEMAAAAMADSAKTPSAGGADSATAGVNSGRTVSATARLRIQMVEIDHEYLNSITNERFGDRTTLLGDIISYHSSASIKLNLANARVLKTDTLIFGETKSNNVSAGNNARWIRMAINAQDLTISPKTFNAIYIKNHPNDAQQIPIDFSLGAGEQIYISGTGLLTYFDLETELANTPPFTIFKSPDYRNQKTTFAIIIELQ